MSEKQFVYLPTVSGGMVRKHETTLSKKERLFVRRTTKLNTKVHTDKALYREAAKEFLGVPIP